ncbi:MAG: lyase domain protein repeat-containing protein [Acidobacteria bacterium]|nr:lyase domain protein repeat-containing protein [Acidobacteriota bacterium]
MSHRATIIFATAILLFCFRSSSGLTRSFIPVAGATLKAKIESATAAGRTNAPGGRFWVGYQFEARPGVAIDYEVVDDHGGLYISMDGPSLSFDSQYETRELGFFLLFENLRDLFTRAEVYNLKRTHEFSGYPVYWAGRIGNEESLNYLKSVIDAPPLEVNPLADRAAFAIALHDDGQVESILINLIRRPLTEPMRSRAIYWLGYAPESQAKNNFLADIVRDAAEWTEARQQAMAALGLSRAATTLALLQNLYETMTSRELKRRALAGISRNDNRDAAATYLIHVADSEKETELRKSAIAGLGRIAGEKSLGALTNTLDSDPDTEIQKQAVMAISRRARDEAIPILIRTARSHPKMPVRKQAIQMLGQTGDERAVALFKELLSK